VISGIPFWTINQITHNVFYSQAELSVSKLNYKQVMYIEQNKPHIYWNSRRTTVYILIGWMTVFGVFNRAFAAEPFRCQLFLAGFVASTTPPHILLKEGWIQSRTQPETRTATKSEWTARDYIYSDKIKLYSREYNSLSNTIEPEGGMMAAFIADPSSPEQQARLRKNYRGGTQASTIERHKRRQELEQILDYGAGIWKHADEIDNRYGMEKLRSIFVDIYRETSERVINFLIAEGVLVDVSNNQHRMLSAKILTEGTHRLNKRAAQILQEYDGATLWYQPGFARRGGFASYANEIELSEAELLTLDVKSATLGHELRHARNDIDGTRDFGSAKAENNAKLPGRPIVYERYQSYEEAETHSYSLRREAQNLLRMIQIEPLANSAQFENGLLNLAFQSGIVAERNSIITRLLDEALKRGVQPRFDYNSIRRLGDYKYTAKFQLSYEGKPFEYEIVIHDENVKTVEQRMAYIRAKVDEMIRLNPNYMTQFHVVQQATEILVSATTAREKAAILEGIISITRPHFWDDGNFVVVKESDLIQRFNSVVSDRWIRFSHIPN